MKQSAYFGEGRCSGHAQFNGGYCRDVAGPERWCIHCEGFMLQQQIAEQVQTIATLRTALVGLVGVDGRVDLEQMEAVMRLTPMPAQDKAATIDAIHALVATLSEPEQAS